ncbi:MAG: aminomethyl-transferring glycine dehydrogenase [Cyclobacteriaceae bacterium]|nr:aminomethyl-transferring glycine dehydrogenase [Cyclobacteriaceae bacterium]
MNLKIQNERPFHQRHNGPDEAQVHKMLQAIEVESLQDLIDETVPSDIILQHSLNIPNAMSESQFLHNFRRLVKKNKIFKSFIGLGYYNCHVPTVIQRNILENPGWYTAYTPYQAEIAQGRLEALINFQTMVSDLTGMELANASLLDEGTAAAEAMTMFYNSRKKEKKHDVKFFVHHKVFPQTLDILRTRAVPLGIELVIGSLSEFENQPGGYFGVLIQYPDKEGGFADHQELIHLAHQNRTLVVVAADLLSLTLLKPPGEMGADVVMGTTQRFGVPMGYGGPHAAYFATKEEFKRQIPGRIIGVSVDAQGHKAYRMALQTREQHIRREKATSNICTAQVLLAVMAGMYGVYHGPQGVKDIASRIHGLTRVLARGLGQLGFKIINPNYFDTLTVEITSSSLLETIKVLALSKKCNFRYDGDIAIGIALDETTTVKEVELILNIFAKATQQEDLRFQELQQDLELDWPTDVVRTSNFMTHEVFNSYHSEHQMLRYLKRLENKDLSLVHSMISLGSCTMKLNATTEMIPVTWPEIGGLHPFAPRDQALGYREMFTELEGWLSEITGFEATSLQPNSGAQGEFTGLMVIRAYHQSRNETSRNVALIPSSAHGTNPASAVMAGMQVVIVACDDQGNIDLEDLKKKISTHQDEVAALMVTYPSTHGVFEEKIREICDLVHDAGGLVYMDGANMNAQVGLTNPAMIGGDVCHLNLHKTFCIPHGGGGPGMGPICVAAHLKPFLPGSPVINMGPEKAITAVSAAPWGSASILAISYAYIALMGADGLKKATELAILTANYVMCRLQDSYEILYRGHNGRCAHEMIIDCRDFRTFGVEVEDIAKRLMDYGFHAPTVSFPVAGTMMIEPTESESLEELDRFCDALIAIRKEITEVESGQADAENNVLKNAPHTAAVALNDQWDYPYSRAKAVYPLPFVKDQKFWPAVSRIDSAYGDRNLFCSCIPVESYLESEAVATSS